MIKIAAVIEICHTTSLIHDDIIDDAYARRGQLSVQKKFGREMAVYAISRTGLKKKPYYSTIFGNGYQKWPVSRMDRQAS